MTTYLFDEQRHSAGLKGVMGDKFRLQSVSPQTTFSNANGISRGSAGRSPALTSLERNP